MVNCMTPLSRVFGLVPILPVPVHPDSGTEGARLHTGHRTLHHHRIHHPLLPSQACRITPYRAHHSFKLHLQPEWTHHQCYVLRSPGLFLQLCPGFQCGGLGPLHPCVHLCPDAPPWHPQPHPPHQTEQGAPLVHGSHLWHHPLLLHDTGDSGVLVVQRGHQRDCLPNWIRAGVRRADDPSTLLHGGSIHYMSITFGPHMFRS